MMAENLTITIKQHESLVLEQQPFVCS